MWCSSFGENLPHVTMVGYDGHRSNMEQALPQLCCTSTTELENKSGQILKLCEFEAKEINVKPLLTFMLPFKSTSLRLQMNKSLVGAISHIALQ